MFKAILLAGLVVGIIAATNAGIVTLPVAIAIGLVLMLLLLR